MDISVEERKSDSEISSPSWAFIHTPYYCEENVYFLCKKLIADGIADGDGADLFVVFISNGRKQVPLWRQRVSSRADGAVVWDYHVICIQKRKDAGSAHLVWDLDATLLLPSPLTSYLSEVVRTSTHVFPEYRRYFRVVHAPLFMRSFASDRSHMRDKSGEWMAPPPPYDPIKSEDGSMNNLPDYMEINGHDVMSIDDVGVIDVLFQRSLGVVLAEHNLHELFSLI